MQKKLIALAVAGILAAPLAAQAATAEVYGKVYMSVGSINNDDPATTNEDGKLSVTSHDSRFGVKGSEDLDGGLKAIYQFETEVDFDDDNSTSKIFDSMRNTYIGLAGDFGEVRLGRHDTPYKFSRGKTDVWAETHGDYNAIMGDNHDNREDNSIIYISPVMNGVTVAAGYITDLTDDDLVDSTYTDVDGSGTLNAGDLAKENDAISLAAMYSEGPLYASLAYQSLGENGAAVAGAANEDAEATRLAVIYNLGMTKLGFAYEMDDQGGSNNDQDRMYFSVTQNMGDGVNLKLAYTIADDRGNTADSGATHLALGATKKLGDTTEIYAVYSAVDNDKNAGFNLVEVESAGPAGGDSSASALAVGVNLKFSSM